MRVPTLVHAACLLAACHLAARAAEPTPRATEARPLLLGNWADPTVLRDGDAYYMTHSSFDYQPGLLLWRSKDLRQWEPVSYAVRNQQGSIWAPELVKHSGRYVIYYPAGQTNWVVTADRIEGPWSEPASIGIGRIDPGHVVDEAGRQFIHLSGGHAVEMSPDGLRAMPPSKRVYDGWPVPRDWAIECVCLESPKFTRKDGWYYMTSAQGGTAGPATSHMVVAARSTTPLGPWENAPHNPIIRTWSRDEPWWSKGHATLVEGPRGQWYAVLHGFMNGQRTLGRCTLVEPIEWTADGWYRVPAGWPESFDASANLPLSDEFDGQSLGLQWQFHQQWDSSRFSVRDGALMLRGRGGSAGASQPLTVPPMHAAYEIETELEMSGRGVAGLMLFGGADAHIGLGLDETGKLRRVQDGFRRYRATEEPTLESRRVSLRIVNDRQDVRFYYRVGGEAWRILQPSAEVSAATSGGGWTALRPALFCTGEAEARFTYFHYRPLGESKP